MQRNIFNGKSGKSAIRFFLITLFCGKIVMQLKVKGNTEAILLDKAWYIR